MAPSMLDDFVPNVQQRLLDQLRDHPHGKPTEGDIVGRLALPGDRECNNKRVLKAALRELHEKWTLATRDLKRIKKAQEKKEQKVENDRRIENGERLDGRPQRDAARIAKAKLKRRR